MNNTKETILFAALRLFANDGYEAVSVSAIAGELGITKGALYKHYKNKRDILESIVLHMEQRDFEQAQKFDLPEGTFAEMSDKYRNSTVEQIINFSREQLNIWTKDTFASDFRKMLVLEQFRDAEMRSLYQNYLVKGPLDYVTDLLRSLGYESPQLKAAELYAPMFFIYSLYDGGCDEAYVSQLADAHFDSMYKKLSLNLK